MLSSKTMLLSVAKRSFATVGPKAVLHRSGGRSMAPSAEWIKQTAAQTTPFDDYKFA